jgi:hypothetical protein
MNNEPMHLKRYYTAEREKHNENWINNKADMLLPLLPANAEQLAKKTKYSQHTIHKFIYALMKQGKVISLSAPGMKPIYERK